ncbi:MAG: homoaconitate hydratase [Candidatus Helarchaeota archaeon]|nr:homoaconitate hydratase [Candidatus Helarchaeota archaeon]
MVKVTMDKWVKSLPEEYQEAYLKGWAHNYALEGTADQYDFASAISFADTTCRDGEQQPGIVFTPEQKVDIVQTIADAGITLIEIGYPGVSVEEERACKMIRENAPKAFCYVMARANQHDIDAALRSDAKILDLFTSCSEFHIRKKLGITPEENIESYLKMLDYACDHDMGIVFGMEDISRSHIDYYVKIIKEVHDRAGKHWLGTGISDTVGIFNPKSAVWFYKQVQSRLPGIPLGMHFHNDLGMATANTLACIEAGCSTVQGTILGIGERCGNTALEEIIVALKTIYGLKLRQINYDKLMEACEKVSRYAGIPIPPNKPIVGMNAFRHESGIHAHGVMSGAGIYEIIPHDWIGRKSEFAFGKFSGTAVVLEEILKPQGINPTKEQLREIVMKVKDQNEKREAEKRKEKEEFVKKYYEYIRSMTLSMDEVLDIAKEVMKK